MADALDSGSSGSNLVQVQVLLSAPCGQYAFFNRFAERKTSFMGDCPHLPHYTPVLMGTPF